MKLLKFGFFSMALLVLGLYFLAPVSWDENENAWMISSSKEINRSACEVYQFLGNSNQAAQWSSFVKNIELLNALEKDDGSPGSRRICYVKENLPGSSWVEEILINESCTQRRLSIEQMKGFWTTANQLFTDQEYQDMGYGKTKLTLNLYLRPETPMDYLKFTLFSPYISGIFSTNLNNIKSIVEGFQA